MFQVIDTLEGDLVVATFPSFVKAQRAARSVEEVPEGRPLGFRAMDGATRDWRYQLRRVAMPFRSGAVSRVNTSVTTANA